MVRSLITSLLVLAAASVSAQTCPPEGFTSKAVFNPFSYFTGSWYTLKQTLVAFEPVDTLYCVSGDLTIGIQNHSIALTFFNGGSTGGVTGTRSTASLNGTIPDLTKPSQATVGPHHGSYWVIEAGTYADLLSGKTEFVCNDYEWAIVSGGAPVAQSNGACLPGVGSTNFKGFWLLTRIPVVSQDAVDKLTALAAAKGYDVSALHTVPQAGCTYK